MIGSGLLLPTLLSRVLAQALGGLQLTGWPDILLKASSQLQVT